MSLFKTKKAEPFEINDKPLKCLICGHGKFWERAAQLNTPAASFFDFDWANQTGACLVCSRCGYIHWFLTDLPPEDEETSTLGSLLNTF